MGCGHCGTYGVFLIKHAVQTPDLLSWTAVSECPACRKIVRLFATVPLSNDVQKPDTTVYADPAPKQEREPVAGIELLESEDLRYAYQDALDTFNSGAPATAVLNQCRQALEAIAQSALPQDKQRGSLANHLRELPSAVDLSKPFLDMAEAVRYAGNMGSHFRAGRRIPQEFREEMMDMLDQLLEYLFILPKQVSDTRKRITSMDEGVQMSQTPAPSDS